LHSPLLSLCGALALLSTAGCSASAYDSTLLKVDNVNHLVKATASKEIPAEAQVFMELPRIKAHHCLQRAVEDYRSAGHHTRGDMALLIIAGVVGGTGTTLSAAGAATSGDGPKQNLGIAGVTLLAAGGAVLGLRTVLNLGEAGRAQRVAAAKSVDAALTILTKYALADDPQTVEEDGFATCRDEDIAVANALNLGNKVTMDQLTNQAKAEQKKADETAVEKKQTAAKTTAGLIQSKKALGDAQKKVDDVQLKINPLVAPRGGRPPAPAAQAAEETKAKDELAKAQADVEEKEKANANAMLDAAKAELAAAQAELAVRKVHVIEAGGALRRAVYFKTSTDVDAALAAMKDAFAEVKAIRERIKSMQEIVDKLQFVALKPAETSTPAPAPAPAK
jgi:hypothetical protein